MKKLLLISFLSLILISLVSAAECTEPGFKWCWQESDSYGPLTATVRVYWQFEDDNGEMWDHYPYAVGNLYVKGSMSGISDCGGSQFCDATIYGYGFYNEPSLNDVWNKVSCAAGGCSVSGYDFTLPTTKKLATKGESYTDCLMLTGIIWVTDYDYWMWKGAGYGWAGTGNCLNIRVVECNQDSDCPSGQICDKSGSWETWFCKAEELPCPDPWTYDPSYTTDIVNCVVWQYVPEYSHCPGGGWFVYNYQQPEISSMTMTETEYQSIAPSECWQCNTLADTDCDNTVDRAELGVYITSWIGGSVTRDNLGLAIVAWASG